MRQAGVQTAFLCAALAGCATPVLGTVENGVYTHPEGRFSCPLDAPALGLSGAPDITDAIRIVETENIPLWEREPSDWRSVRITSDETMPAATVQFHDISGASVEITSGIRHEWRDDLHDGLGGGFVWTFDERESPRRAGWMAMSVGLMPWFGENGVTYMGGNTLDLYRRGQGPDAQLRIAANLVVNEARHHVVIHLPVENFLPKGMDTRNLLAIRDDIGSRPELQAALFAHAEDWLSQCRFEDGSG